jgi:hypothetical protein
MKLLFLLMTLARMPGNYVATEQVIHDDLPDGTTRDQVLKAGGGEIEIQKVYSRWATLYVAYPGMETRKQEITDIGTGRVRMSETDPVIMGCDPTIEVAALPEAEGAGFEFTLDDVRFSGPDREYCLSLWHYPLRGKYRWTFDADRGRIEIRSVGDFEDLDGVVKHRTLTLGFDRH